LKAKFGLCYEPPPCTGVFSDVPCPSGFAPWIEALADLGVTGGCGPGIFCPQNPVRRDQMAAFLLKAKYGSTYVPPPCSGDFGDVTCPSLFADWIEQLAAEAITSGCGGNNYCPLNPNTRGQMAVFVIKTFNLQ
jgi:S-layer homology domain